MKGIDFLKDRINIMDFTVTQDEIINIIIKFATIIFIIFATKILIKVVNKLIEKFFHTQKNSRFPINEKKADTLSELLKSVVRYTLYFISILWIAEQILPNSTKTILTLTSVAGVAIGFGAQSVVKDVIAGFFILFEDQFAVGDYIMVDNMSGIVEAVGLRVTKLRDFTGDLHIIPNGSIVKVTNKSRGNMRALVNVDIAYEEDIDHAVKVIKETCQEIKKEYQDIIVEGPDVSGVTNLGTSGITLRVIAKTIPMKQWDVEMEMRRRIKYALDKEGIEIPYPRNVIIHKDRER